MNPFTHRGGQRCDARIACLALLGAFGVGGCATYEPAPVDPIAFEASWRALDPDAATVRVGTADVIFFAGVTKVRPPGFDLTDGIDLAEAEAVALFFNPELRRLRTALEVPRAEASTAGAWADQSLCHAPDTAQ